jgi:putative hydrolase
MLLLLHGLPPACLLFPYDAIVIYPNPVLRQDTIYDFHTHTTLSDGTLSPLELIRRAAEKGYRGIALTDHVGTGSLERVIRETIEDCRLARCHWDIVAIPGVELTHVPAHAIREVSRRAKELGACMVVVHGETITEPVEKGTNLAAVQSPDVDILAHPGLLTLEEARLAVANRVHVEISARKGHCLTNGHVAQLALATGVKLVLNSDAHDSPDLLTQAFAVAVLKGCGLNETELEQVLSTNPQALVNELTLPGLS